VALTAAQRAERNRQIAAAQDAIRRGESITAQNIVNNMIGRNVGGAANALQNAINNIQPTVVQSPLVPLNPETGDTDNTTTTAETVDPNAYAKELEAQRRDRLVQVTRQFMKENGMEEMMAGMEKYVRAGYTGDQIWIMLYSDDAYKAAYNRRFAANEARAAAGLARLLPATYIELEDGYRSAMISRGMPEGLFDSNDDFTDLIAKDISVKEVEDRLDTALDYINFSGNDAVRSELREIYGMTDSEMAAYVIDPDRTSDYLERESNKRFRQASVGGAAQNTGVSLADDLRNEIADMYAASTWQNTFSDTQQKFTSVASQSPLYKRLGLLSDAETSDDDLVKEQFNTVGAASAAAKKSKLASQERARFSGSSGISKTSLAQKRVR
jgi:nicotinamide mononucleotide adenylyltransferase